MPQRVIIIESRKKSDLEEKLNEFARNYHIESISYAIVKFGYDAQYSCCVVYTNK